jgi:hypothetical protein
MANSDRGNGGDYFFTSYLYAAALIDPMETDVPAGFAKDAASLIPIATLIDELKHDNMAV